MNEDERIEFIEKYTYSRNKFDENINLALDQQQEMYEKIIINTLENNSITKNINECENNTKNIELIINEQLTKNKSLKIKIQSLKKD